MSLDDLLAGSSTWAVDQNCPKRNGFKIYSNAKDRWAEDLATFWRFNGRGFCSIEITMLMTSFNTPLPIPEEAYKFLFQAHFLSCFIGLWLGDSAQENIASKVDCSRFAPNYLADVPFESCRLPFSGPYQHIFGPSRGTAHSISRCSPWLLGL